MAAETKSFLGTHGISLVGSQATKTRKALEFFAGGATPGAEEGDGS